MTIAIFPITTPRRRSGTRVSTVVIISGSIMAVPAAWTTRPATRKPNPGAAALAAVPRMNRPIATVKTPRRLKRWIM